MKFPSRKTLIGYATIVATILFSVAMVSVPTNTLLGFFGIENAYFFVYMIAFLGSITTFASIPYPLMLLNVVSGGLDPLLAGSLSALGVTTADICTFFVARRGQAIISEKMSRSLTKIGKLINKYPKLYAPSLVAYGIFSPVSNDFAVISLSLMKFSFWRVVPLLAIGNIIYNLSIAFVGVYAYDSIVNLF